MKKRKHLLIDSISNSNKKLVYRLGHGCSQLMRACQQGDNNTVINILHFKPEQLRIRDSHNRSALHYCTGRTVRYPNNLVAAASIAISAPELLESADEDGFTPLHLAIIQGNLEMVNLLLANKANVNAVDKEGHSVIHWATVCGEVEALRAILAAGANIGIPDINGGTPLHYAAQMCGATYDCKLSKNNSTKLALTILEILLAHPQCKIDVQDKDGRQPLLWAASSGSAKAIILLIKAGARVESSDKDGLTALHCAASRGNTECIDTLISLCGAPTDLIDCNGCTALHYAVTLGHADATSRLLDLEADPNRQDRKGRTPAHCGCAKGQLETVKLLNDHHANLWLRNAKGDLPMHEAASSGRRELVEWLLEQRPKQVNVTSNDGRSMLHIAAQYNYTDICKILLDYGADINAIYRNTKGIVITPLDCALQKGHRATAKFLQTHGGLPSTKLHQSISQRSNPFDGIDVDVVRPLKYIDKEELYDLHNNKKYVICVNQSDSEADDQIRKDCKCYKYTDKCYKLITQRKYHDLKCLRRRTNSCSEPEKNKNDDIHRSKSNIEIRRRKQVRYVSSSDCDDEDSCENCCFHKHAKQHVILKKRSFQPKSIKDRRHHYNYGVRSITCKSTILSDINDNTDTTKESAQIKDDDLESVAKEETQKYSQLHDSDVKSANIQESLHNLEHDIEKVETVQVAQEEIVTPDKEIGTGDEEVINTDLDDVATISKDIHDLVKTEEDAVKIEEIVKPVEDTVKSEEEDVVKTEEDDIISKKELEDTTQLQEESVEETIHEKPDEVTDEITEEKLENVSSEKLLEEEEKPINSIQLQGSESEVCQEPEEIVHEDKVKDMATDDKQDTLTDDNDNDVEKDIDITTNSVDNVQSKGVDKLEEKETAEKISTSLINEDAVEQEETPVELDEKVENDIKLASDASNIEKKVELKTDIEYHSPNEFNLEFDKIKSEFVDQEVRKSSFTLLSSDSEGDVEHEEEQERKTSFQIIESDEDFINEYESTSTAVHYKGDPVFKVLSPTDSTNIQTSIYKNYTDKTDVKSTPGAEIQSKSFDHFKNVTPKSDYYAPHVKSAHKKHKKDKYTANSFIKDHDSGFEPSPRCMYSKIPTPRDAYTTPRVLRRPLYTTLDRRSCVHKKSDEMRFCDITAVTKSIQRNIRRYYMERKIFQHLLELKSLQIRSNKLNEAVLVKRAVDDYHKSCSALGGEIGTRLRRYKYPEYSFKNFELFLYETLKSLQKPGTNNFQNINEVYEEAERRLSPDYRCYEKALQCTTKTHRCLHATHAYTGIPCAAYIPMMNHHTMPKFGFGSYKKNATGNIYLPKILSTGQHCRGKISLELTHSKRRELVSLPSDKMDCTKKYYVTFEVKDSPNNADDMEITPSTEGKSHSVP